MIQQVPEEVIKEEYKGIPDPVEGSKVATKQDHNILVFKVPTFQGGMLKGDTSIEVVDRAFHSANMAGYLEFWTYCNNNPC